MNLKEIKPYYDEQLDIKIRHYLSPEEIELIAEEMLKHNKTTERDYVRNVLLCKIVTDIPEDFNYADNYMQLVDNGGICLLEEQVYNILEIDDYVRYAESVQMQIAKMFKSFDKPINDLLIKCNDLIQDMDKDKLIKLLAKNDRNKE